MKIRFDPPEQQTPDRDQGMKVQYGETRRAIVRWRWYLILFIVSSPLIYFFVTIIQAVLLVEADGYIQLDQTDIHSPASGQIQELLVRAQETVSAGQPLVKINSLTLEDRRARLENEILALNHEKFLSNNSAAQQAAQERITFANKQRDYYQKRLTKYQSLYSNGAATESEINTARAQYEDSLNTAMQENLRFSGPTLDSRQRDTKLHNLDMELATINSQIALQIISAPKSAKVSDLFVHVGEFVGSGTLIAQLVSQDEITITAFLPPRFSDYAEVGRTATVKFPHGETKTAHISEVPELTRRSPVDISSVFAERPIMILIKLQFDEPIERPLANGLPVSLRFHFGWE
ncbi:MAG: HlyD family efflux transporter periplasmic adaptor subunit [Pseudomonadales bacterium]|nr:HlyD family efflux transporter periplasmic adaptor subunit [Pseudomonadales bacterium]